MSTNIPGEPTQNIPNLHSDEMSIFYIKDYTKNCLEWLDMPKIETNISQPTVAGEKGIYDIRSQGILLVLINISKSLGVELIVSPEACAYGGGLFSVHNKEKKILIAPRESWSDTPGAGHGLPGMTADQHINSTLAHEIGHAAGGCAASNLRIKRGAILALIAFLFIFAASNIAYSFFLSYPNNIPYICTGVSIVILGPILYLYLDMRVQAKEETIAEIIGYCIMRSIYEGGSDFRKENWRAFEYSRMHLLRKIATVRRKNRVDFIKNLHPEIEKRIKILNKEFIKTAR